MIVKDNRQDTIIQFVRRQEKNTVYTQWLRPGVRGGHVRWTKTSTVLLPAGLYDIYVRHDNAVYTGEYADKGASDLSFCEVSMTFAYDTVPSLKCPLLINAVFSQCQTETDERTALELAQEPTSYSASGFIYRGYIDVYYSEGTTKRIPAQTGGWVAMKSPFKVTKDKTSFDPYLWPDTACPTCLKAPAKHAKIELIGRTTHCGSNLLMQ